MVSKNGEEVKGGGKRRAHTIPPNYGGHGHRDAFYDWSLFGGSAGMDKTGRYYELLIVPSISLELLIFHQHIDRLRKRSSLHPFLSKNIFKVYREVKLRKSPILCLITSTICNILLTSTTKQFCQGNN